MNYQQIYNQLISKRQQETPPKNCYTETHHIKPKCLGGTNETTNLVKLTAREHYIAHLLLAKIYNTYGLYAAVNYMHAGRLKNRKFKFNSRLYQKIREEFANKLSQKMKGTHHSKETKLKMSKSRKGKHHTEEAKQKMSIAKKGMKFSEQHKKKLSDALKGKPLTEEHKQKVSDSLKGKQTWMKGKHLSEQHKQKIAIANKGAHRSEEAKRHMSEAMKGKNKGKTPWNKGKHLSEEHKQKVSNAFKDHYYFNNGIKNVIAKSCPEGFVRGRLKKK